MAGVDIRGAAERDIPSLIALLRELGGLREQADPEGAEHRAVLHHFLADPEARIFIACRGPRLVGAAALVFRLRLNVATREAWIPELVVTVDERGKGIGQALVERCVAEARRRGCHQVRLESGN